MSPKREEGGPTIVLHELNELLTKDQLEDLVHAMNAGWLLRGLLAAMTELAELEPSAGPATPADRGGPGPAPDGGGSARAPASPRVRIVL